MEIREGRREKVLVISAVSARGRGSGIEVESRVTALYELRSGKSCGSRPTWTKRRPLAAGLGE